MALLTPLIGSLALAASAQADVYCAPSPCVGDRQDATIKQAVADADTHAGPDTVSIGAGTFNVGSNGFGLTVNSSDTAVHGAGAGLTILTEDAPPSTASYASTVIQGYMSSLADLTLRLPTDVTPGQNSSVQGADVYNGIVERVRVDAVGATFGPASTTATATGSSCVRGRLRTARSTWERPRTRAASEASARPHSRT